MLGRWNMAQASGNERVVVRSASSKGRCGLAVSSSWKRTDGGKTRLVVALAQHKHLRFHNTETDFRVSLTVH